MAGGLDGKEEYGGKGCMDGDHAHFYGISGIPAHTASAEILSGGWGHLPGEL